MRNFSRDKRRLEEMKKKKHEEKLLKKLQRAQAGTSGDVPAPSPDGTLLATPPADGPAPSTDGVS